MIYRRILKPVLFRCDAEWAHDQAISWSSRLQRVPGFVSCASRWNRVSDHRLHVQLAGIRFDNPIGLAAGYDKSGRAIDGMASLGFGHVEIGSISALPSSGNPKPRLWRLPQDDAVCVHYGLPNEGAVAVANRLAGRRISVPLGINLVNTNQGPSAEPQGVQAVLDDYLFSARTLAPFASYLMLNLSCPNTADGRDFYDQPRHLELLLEGLESLAIDVPVLLKISPDGDQAKIDRMLGAVDPFSRVKGFMFNLSSTRRSGLTTSSEVWRHWPGAISGRPIKSWMDELIASLYTRMDRQRYQIVAAGGVGSAQDAYDKIRFGASSVQLLTALIYEGPRVVKRINRGLIRLMERDGLANLSEAVGVDAGSTR